MYFTSLMWSKFNLGKRKDAGKLSRGLALFSRTFDTRWEWRGQPNAPAASIPENDPIPILKETELPPGLVWTGGKSHLHRDSNPDRPARSQSLYRLSYPAHNKDMYML